MNLVKFYNSIKNPIDDINIVKTIINAYTNPKGSFKASLLRTQRKDSNKPETYQKDIDYFYSSLFNKWKNNITEINLKRLNKLGINISPNQLKQVYDYLKSIPDLNTEAEVFEALEPKNLILRNNLYKLRWDNIDVDDQRWTTIISGRFTPKNRYTPFSSHNLYINIDSGYIYKLANLFLDKCTTHHVPYKFKFNEKANRDNSFVIFANNKYLLEYIEILNEIIKENPELKSHIKTPPVLSGKINGWIGYGAEFKIGNEPSFEDKRIEVLEKAIVSVTSSHILRYKDYFYKKVNNQISKQTTEIINKIFWDKFKVWKQENSLSFQDLFKKSFRKKTYKEISKSIYDELNQLCTNGEVKDLKVSYQYKGKDVNVVIPKSFMSHFIKNMAMSALKIPNYAKEVQYLIKAISDRFDIDKNKFCFDSSSKKLLKNMTLDTVKKFNLCISILKEQSQIELSEQLSHYLDEYLSSTDIRCDKNISYNFEGLSKVTINQIKKTSFETISWMINNKKDHDDLYNNLMDFMKVYLSGQVEKKPTKRDKVHEILNSKRTYRVEDEFIIDSKTGEIIDQRKYNDWERVINLENIDKDYDYTKDEYMESCRQELINSILLELGNDYVTTFMEKEGPTWEQRLRKMVEVTVDRRIDDKIETARLDLETREKPTYSDDVSIEELEFALENFNIVAQVNEEYIYDTITGQEVESERTKQVVRAAYAWVEVAGKINCNSLSYSNRKQAFDEEHKKIFNYIKKQVTNQLKEDGVVVPQMIEESLPKSDSECQRVYRGLFKDDNNPTILKRFFYPTLEQPKSFRKNK